MSVAPPPPLTDAAPRLTSDGVFLISSAREPHAERTRAILRDHPEVRELFGRNPWTAAVIAAVVALQLALAYALRGAPWWVVAAIAYAVGAFADHALYVCIHEATHDLVFRRRWQNRIAGIAADLVNVVPAAISFRAYHLKHHSFQGVYELDADIPSRWEARLFGARSWAKALWLLFFPIVQVTRPPRLREVRFLGGWTVANWLPVFAVDAAVFHFWGPTAFLYLVLSFAFAIGLHPLGARWIQEHYLVAPPQETYSYYGPANRVALNVGYHVEHHDFPSVPWNRLPRVRAIAPEQYDGLVHHRSWARLLVRFLTDPALGVHSRVVRAERGGVALDAAE